MAMSIQTFVYRPLISMNTEDTFLQDFLEILKRRLQTLRKCFLGTTKMVMLSVSESLSLTVKKIAFSQRVTHYCVVEHAEHINMYEIPR